MFVGSSSFFFFSVARYEWDANGLPRFSANVVTAPGKGPFPGVFVGAGMVFARSELLIDCPFDPHLPFLFSGEEVTKTRRNGWFSHLFFKKLLLAACAFSHGWDIYNPSFTPVFHYYKVKLLEKKRMESHKPIRREAKLETRASIL